MRMLAALLLFVSMLTTHAAALEHASAKAIGFEATPATISVTEQGTGVWSDLSVVTRAASASEAETGSCLSSGDCAFLLPIHRFESHALIPAHGPDRQHHARTHLGRGVERPPIS